MLRRLNGTLAMAALGAGVMYLLDPQQGRRRRALLRDKAVRLGHETAELAGRASRDLGNRTRGLGSLAAGALRREQVGDEVLHERVRARLGRLVSNPSSIEVRCEAGRCTLAGPVFAPERATLVAAISRVRGVAEVVDRLEPHDPSETVPGLQGEPARPEPRLDILQSSWAPATRTLVGLTGGALLGVAAVRRDPLSLAGGALGAGMLVRSVGTLH
jgi:hypothetical protein